MSGKYIESVGSGSSAEIAFETRPTTAVTLCHWWLLTYVHEQIATKIQYSKVIPNYIYFSSKW